MSVKNALFAVGAVFFSLFISQTSFAQDNNGVHHAGANCKEVGYQSGSSFYGLDGAIYNYTGGNKNYVCSVNLENSSFNTSDVVQVYVKNPSGGTVSCSTGVQVSPTGTVSLYGSSDSYTGTSYDILSCPFPSTSGYTTFTVYILCTLSDDASIIGYAPYL